MGHSFSATPTETPIVLTRHRAVVAPLPHPDSLPTVATLQKASPSADSAFTLPLVWDCAEDYFVYDSYGNRWIDCSSTGLSSNAGHAVPEVRQAILDQVQRGLLQHGQYPSKEKAELISLLSSLAPEGHDQVQLFSSTGDAIRTAIDLCRFNAANTRQGNKHWIIGFNGWLHAPAFDTQYLSLSASLIRPDTDLSGHLVEQGIDLKEIAAVVVESSLVFQQGEEGVQFVQELSAWCKLNNILLIWDESQTGMGRTGKFWSFEHFKVVPDLICCGDNLTSSLPIGALIGRSSLWASLDGAARVCHSSGNALSCSVALVAIQSIIDNELIHNAAAQGQFLQRELGKIQDANSHQLGQLSVQGLYAKLEICGDDNLSTGYSIVEKCFQKGVLLGLNQNPQKNCCEIIISPPLSITQSALAEVIEALNQAISEPAGTVNQVALLQ